MQAFSSARVLLALAFVATLTGVFAVGTSTAATAQELGKTMTTPSGLQITDTKKHAFYLKPGERRRLKSQVARRRARKSLRKRNTPHEE